MSLLSKPAARDIPVAVPGDLIFAREPGLLAYAGAFTASSAGFEFAIRICSGPARRPEPVSWAMGPDERGPRSWLEVSFADGRTCAADLTVSTRPEASQDIQVVFLFGEDGDGCSDSQWWVSPLPPSGPVELIIHFDGQLAHTASLDASTLIDAAGTVEKV